MRRFIVCLLFATLAFAQTARFEVASIKPSSPDAHGSSMMTDNVGGLRAENMPLRALITSAYGIRDFQLLGAPGWIGTDRYDIIAKPEREEAAPAQPEGGKLSDEQRKTRDELWKQRVRSLLAERFGLVMHRETKEVQIYLLTVAKGGSKLKEVTTPGDRQGMSNNRGRNQGFAAPTDMLAMNLASTVGRPVENKTGLTGKYDWVLEYDPDVSGSQSQEGQTGDAARPTIFTALQDQLGLKLEVSKGPVENYVIDKIERPSEN